MTTITALPTPPSRADSTNFSTRGDAFLGALPTFVTEANAVGSEATAAAAAAAASASAAAASQSTASTAAAAVAAQSPVANAAAAAASAAAAAASAAAAAQTSGAVAATTLSASSTVSGTGFSTYLASPPAIGGTAPAAVSATALSYTTTLTGGTGIVNLGSGQVYKDASGNVGIGTSTPDAIFHVSRASTSTTIGNSTAIAKVVNTQGTLLNETSGIEFFNKNFSGSAKLAGIYGVYENYNATGYAGALVFATEAAGSTNVTERMRIDSSGNVGIGTSSPAGKIDIVTGTYRGFFDDAGGTLFRLNAVNAPNTLYGPLSLNGSVLTFQISASERMRIDSSGNVTVSTAALLGYGTGSGGTVTQATSKSTAVTLNKPTGQISVNNSALGANVSAVFTFNNTLISASDVLLISRRSNGIALDSYSIDTMCGSGVAYVAIRNITAGSLSESLELSFAVIKGSTT